MLIGSAIKHLSFLISINFPMAAISTTHITNVRHFSNMALNSSYAFLAHFSQFLRCNLRILSDLIFYPFVKIFFFSITLGIILGITLGITLCWSHKCHYYKTAIN